MADDLFDVTRMSEGRTRRSSTYDRSGGNHDCTEINPGETVTLLDVEGAGVVRHIWITIASNDPWARKNVVVRCYWEHADEPSVEAPLGDFFGQGWGESYELNTKWLAAAPLGGRSLVCYIPMPYRKAARITLQNEGDGMVERLYYYVDYEEGPIPPDAGLLHAQYRQEVTKPETDLPENEWGALGPVAEHANEFGNYLWMETEGRGHFFGVNYYITNPSPMWYGEGDDMFLIDGESWPGLHGTGTEDYFNTAWSPDSTFLNESFGIARAPGRGNDQPRLGWFGRTHLYRYHHLDPIRFQSGLQASIEHGHANALTLGLESVAYWYQSRPVGLLPMPPAADRRPMPLPTISDIHRWKAAFAELRGEPSWGNEKGTEHDPKLY